MKKVEKDKEEKILNRSLFRFRQGFEQLANIESSAEFSFKLIKNVKLVEAGIADLDDMIKPSDDYTKKYQPMVEEIAKKHCIKDKAGNPMPRVAPNGAALYDFTPEEKPKFDKAIEALEKKPEFTELVAERKAQLQKYNDAMDLPCEITFIKIPMRILPAKITPSQLNNIFELIEE